MFDAALGAGRCAKALAEFARTARLRLAVALAALDDSGFKHWVARTLALAPVEASGLIAFATDPEAAVANVSPAHATTLTRVMRLVARVGEHVRQPEI